MGTQRDLVLYRIEAAKEDLKSAKILRDADSYKGANNRADDEPYYFTLFSQGCLTYATSCNEA